MTDSVANLMWQAERQQRLDTEKAKASPKWQQAVNFIRHEFDNNETTAAPTATVGSIRSLIAADPEHWILPYHCFWGMAIRNLLRANTFSEGELGIGNLDNIYVELIEEAVK